MKVKKLAIALVCASVVFGLTACGGGNDSPVSESMNSSSNQTEKDESVAAEEDESVADSPANDREFILQLIQAFMPGDTVPESFLECWVDETATASGLTFAEIRNEVLLGEEDSILDEYSEQVVVTCLATLSEEDFVAVMASGILDDDDNEVDENPDAEPDFDRNQKFPDELAPDLVSNPAFADPGIQIIVSPGIVDGYLWEGTISGSGMPPDLVTVIFGCAGSVEMILANFFVACDLSNPTFAFIDDQGNFSATIEEPQPTSPEGSCLLITTDPDDNPDTDDGPGAIICSTEDKPQTYPEYLEEDLSSADAFADPGIKIVISPGIVDGYLWEGTISGSGFTPGETVRLVGCDATYETFVETFLFSCGFEDVTILGDVDEDGSFTSEPLGPIPTGTANGTCAMIGTDPDNNPDTQDGQGAVVCTR